MNSSRKAPRQPITARVGSRRLPLAAGAGVLAVLSILGRPAQSSNYYWEGDNATAMWNVTAGVGGTNWSSASNFNNGTAGIPGSLDDVFFVLQGAGDLSSTLGQNFSIDSLNFTANATSAISIGSGGGTLTIGAGGVTNNAAASVTVSAPVNINNDETWTNNTSNSLTFSGAIGDVTANPSGDTLTIAGSGNITFSGANTYAGDTTVYTGSLTLTGAGALASSNINLGAGTTLTLDNVTNGNSSTRLGATASINSSGGIINLIGSTTTSTNQATGTLNILSGATVISTSGTAAHPSILTFGSDEGVSSLTRIQGGTVLFAVGPNSNVSLPNLENLPGGGLTNGIIGGWAVTGTNAGTGLNFATLSGDNVVPYSSYTQLNGDSNAQPVGNPLLPGNNIQYNATGNNSVEITAPATVNSLYLTGGSTMSGILLAPNNPTGASSAPFQPYYNGITFGDALLNYQNLTLTIGSGGIISSGATGIEYVQGHPNITNSAFIGNLFGWNANDNTGGGNGGGVLGYNGVITTAIGTPDLVVYTDSNLSIASLITDNGTQSVGLTKSGPGTLDLSDGNVQSSKPSNSFSGPVTLNQGILLINAAGQLGTSNQVIFNGGELRTYAGLTTAGTWTVGTQGGAFSYTGGGTSTITNKITGVGGFTYYTRAVIGETGSTIVLNNTAGSGGGTSSNYQGPTSFLFSYADGGNGSGGNTVDGLKLGASNQVPSTSQVILNTVMDTLGYPVTPNIASVALDMNSTNQSFGSIEGNVNLMNLNGTLTIGANNLSKTYTGSLLGSGGTLIKVGSGIQTLSGTNAFTGTTSINGGTLLVGTGTGTTGAGSLAGSVTVGNGLLTGTLGGNGTLSGAVTVTSTGILAPAMSPTTSNTLTISNNLTLNAGASFDFNFGAAGSPGTGDLVKLTGNNHGVTIQGNGSAPDIININPVSGLFGIGTYNLISVTGGGTGSTISNPSGETFTVNGSNQFDYSVGISGKNLVLTVTAGSPILTWSGSAANNTWVNGGSAVWNSGTLTYADPDNVIFNDSGSAHPSVTLNTAVAPNSVLFNGQTTNYTIGGSGSITVATNLTQQGAANDTINTPVTTPATVISGGTLTAGAAYTSTSKIDINNAAMVAKATVTTPQLNVNSGSTLTIASTGSIASGTTLNLGAGAGAVFNNATQSISALTSTSTSLITLNGTIFSLSAPTTYNGSFAGNGTLSHSNGGTLTLTNSSPSFTGTTNVTNNSTLLVTNTSGSATGSGPVNIAGGSILDGTGSIAGQITIAANGVQQGTGAFGTTGGEILNGILAPGGNNAFNTINLGALTINTGAILDFDLSTASTDLAAITGQLNLAGASTLNVNLPFTPALGSYPIFTAGSITGSGNITVNPSGAGLAGLGGNITFTIQKSLTSLLLNIEPPSVSWAGTASSNWNYTEANWSGANGTHYGDGFAVLFSDSTNTNISLTTNVNPAFGLLFSNSAASPYTITSFAGKAIGGAGGITMNGAGTVTLLGPNTFSGTTVINSGTIAIGGDAGPGNDAGPLGIFPTTPTPNSIVIANGGTLATAASASSFLLNGNRGIGIGAGATINVATPIVLSYGGTIANFNNAVGVLNKTGVGELDLAGINTFTGGLNVNQGALKLLTTSAAGTGPITVNNSGSKLVVSTGGGTTANGISLGNGTILGSGSGSETVTGALSIATGASVALDEFDPTLASPSVTNQLVFGGTVSGTSVNIAVNNFSGANVPDAVAGTDGIRFNGAASALSGTITVGPAAKVVVTTTSSSGSPIGSANLVMTGGTNASGQTGTYSIATLANSSLASTTLGNNVSLTGSGRAYLSLAGTAGTTIGLGTLTIGSGQALGVVGTGSNVETVSFTGATLAGGTATLMPGLIGNSAYTSSENIIIGAIGQSVSGSGLTISGVGTVTLTGNNTYTGPTAVTGGTLAVTNALAGSGVTVSNAILSGTGTISATGGVTLGNGLGNADTAILRAGTATAVGTLTVHGLALNSDAGFNFQVNLASDTFSELIDTAGNLALGNGVIPATFTDQSNGSGVTVNQQFALIDLTSGTLSGTFAGLPNNTQFNLDGDVFQVNYTSTEVMLTAESVHTPDGSLQAAPEPGSLASLMSGLSVLLGLHRFRRRNS